MEFVSINGNNSSAWPELASTHSKDEKEKAEAKKWR